MKLSEFETQHVYLVGGTSGIGLAIAKQLSAAGAHIMLLARTQAKLQQAQEEQISENVFLVFMKKKWNICLYFATNHNS